MGKNQDSGSGINIPDPQSKKAKAKDGVYWRLVAVMDPGPREF